MKIIMKHIKFFLAALLAMPLLSACVDDDYQNIVLQGDPQIDAEEIGTVMMGDDFDFTVNCRDAKGTDLSTLKAELLFSNEVVDNVQIRTKEPGDYTVTLHAPFLKFIPNGEAQVRLTLQNVTTSKTIAMVSMQVERPHFSDLLFIDASGNKYEMSEGDDYNYTCTYNTAASGFKGHFETADGEWLFGSNGSDIELGKKGNLDFQTNEPGDITVSFNTRDFVWAPQEEIAIVPLLFSESDNVIQRDMIQGRQYTIGGIVNEEWYVDPDYFEANGDGTYTFRAIDGAYTIIAYNSYKFVQCYAGAKDAPATIQADGSGGLWIIGGNGINKPYLTTSNNKGWWTDPEWDQSLAQIRPKVYQITLTVGQQLSASDVNFKFFGQPAWGIEFTGTATDHHLSCESDIFGVGDGTGGHDNGNIYLKSDATLIEGDTYVFTVDLTAGCANGVLSVKKGAGAGVQTVALEDKTPLVMDVKKGMTFQFEGVVDDTWAVDYDFLQSNGDGTYTFLCINGSYAFKAYADYKYVQVYPVDGEGKPATIQEDGTGSIWVIGSECINKPTLDAANNKGWWTDPDWDQCMAPIAAKKYRITLTVGQQLSATGINFKFFGQPSWGTEFNGQGGAYHLESDNPWFRVNAADSDNGNVFLKDDATLTDGETYVFTIDLTSGVANGVLTVEKK